MENNIFAFTERLVNILNLELGKTYFENMTNDFEDVDDPIEIIEDRIIERLIEVYKRQTAKTTKRKRDGYGNQ